MVNSEEVLQDLKHPLLQANAQNLKNRDKDSHLGWVCDHKFSALSHVNQLIQYNLNQSYLYSAFNIGRCCKAALQE